MPDAKFKLGTHKISVMDGPYLSDGKPTDAARQFAENLISRLDEMRSFVADEYLETYNGDWREDDDPRLTTEEFCARLVDPTIVLFDEINCASTYFKDSMMFGGHAFDVYIDQDEISDAMLIG